MIRHLPRRWLRGLTASVGLFVLLLPAIAAATVETQPVAENLEFPTNLAVAPDGRIFFTEKETGRVRIIEDGTVLPEPFATLPVTGGGETGLLGIALDPAFPRQPWVYLFYSDAQTGHNEIIRLRAEGNRSVATEHLLELPSTANGYHNGGDITFGADGKLYATVGEGHDAQQAQDPLTLGGKVLRINPDGSIPDDNPFGPDNPVYTIGNRNSFGICLDGGTDEIWETENGPEANDEVNRIVAGKNYGWPEQSGPPYGPYEPPILNFPKVIVPTGCAAFNGHILFGDFSGRIHAFDSAAPVDTVTEDLGVPITDIHATSDQRLYIATTDSILKVTDIEVHGIDEVPSPSPEATAAAVGGTTAPVVIISGVVALVAVIVGGFAMSRTQRRRPPPGGTPPQED